MNSVPLWVTIGGFALPLIGLAGSAVGYVVRLYLEAAERRRRNFFELMMFIDGERGVASKVAAVYALRNFTEHRDFVARFCATQRSNITGPNAQSLMDELDATAAAVAKRK